jgi:hypothetical protein
VSEGNFRKEDVVSPTRKSDRRIRDEEPDRPEREGDVLGISDADPDVAIPRPEERGSGRPASGIEVREHSTGIGDVPRRSGATGIDMGAGGEGTHVASRSRRPRSTPGTDEDNE